LSKAIKDWGFLSARILVVAFRFVIDNIKDDPFHPCKVGTFPEYLVTCGTVKEFAEAIVNTRINPVANRFFGF
jgi:hypothetical protein